MTTMTTSRSMSHKNKLGDKASPPTDDDHEAHSISKTAASRFRELNAASSIDSYQGDPVPTGAVRPVEVVAVLATLQLMMGIVYVVLTSLALLRNEAAATGSQVMSIPQQGILLIHLYEGIVMIASASLNKFSERLAMKFFHGLHIMVFIMRAISIAGNVCLLAWNSVELVYPQKSELSAVVCMWFFEFLLYTTLLYYTARAMKSSWADSKESPHMEPPSSSPHG